MVFYRVTEWKHIFKVLANRNFYKGKIILKMDIFFVQNEMNFARLLAYWSVVYHWVTPLTSAEYSADNINFIL